MVLYNDYNRVFVVLNSFQILTKLNYFFQTFRVDRHLPFQDIQTFMFASHIVANVLRVKLVSPIDSSGLLCLRIEIIGCQLLGIGFGLKSTVNSG